MNKKLGQPIAVVAAILVDRGKVMLARRCHGKYLAGYWEFPGGKIENGESAEMCLVRELFEEFGVKVQVEDFVESVTHAYPDFTIELHGYRATVLEGEFVLTDHDSIKWVDPSQLLEHQLAPADIPLAKAVQGLEL